ncbi:Sec-independent protein translocase subunit TatA/TatB [Rubrobacter indicoceani]|uniref:Sec-independent protein translocase subunit TatA/TatB n=1 Tax=Rubrobacter indicoceani TaxID=2051957 RepID=UPI000E5A4999|nr:twin-arginine translocase TatA/TatE family subunit [Rubrobacter indicoceani]
MFGGLGGSEIIVIGILFLVIFGPNKLPQMARDVGKFVSNARRSIDEFKDELSAEAALEDEKPARNRPSKGRKPSRNGSAQRDGDAPETAEDRDREAASRRDDGLNDL